MTRVRRSRGPSKQSQTSSSDPECQQDEKQESPLEDSIHESLEQGISNPDNLNQNNTSQGGQIQGSLLSSQILPTPPLQHDTFPHLHQSIESSISITGMPISLQKHSLPHSHQESTLSEPPDLYFIQDSPPSSSGSIYNQNVESPLSDTSLNRDLHTPLTSAPSSVSQHLPLTLTPPRSSNNSNQEPLALPSGSSKEICQHSNPSLPSESNTLGQHGSDADTLNKCSQESSNYSVDKSNKFQQHISDYSVRHSNPLSLQSETPPVGNSKVLSEQPHFHPATCSGDLNKQLELHLLKESENPSTNPYPCPAVESEQVTQQFGSSNSGLSEEKTKPQIPRPSRCQKVLSKYSNSLPVISEFDEPQQHSLHDRFGEAEQQSHTPFLFPYLPPYPPTNPFPYPPLHPLTYPHPLTFPAPTFDSSNHSNQQNPQTYSSSTNNQHLNTYHKIASNNFNHQLHPSYAGGPHRFSQSYPAIGGDPRNLIQPSNPPYAGGQQNFNQQSHALHFNQYSRHPYSDSYNLRQQFYPPNNPGPHNFSQQLHPPNASDLNNLIMQSYYPLASNPHTHGQQTYSPHASDPQYHAQQTYSHHASNPQTHSQQTYSPQNRDPYSLSQELLLPNVAELYNISRQRLPLPPQSSNNSNNQNQISSGSISQYSEQTVNQIHPSLHNVDSSNSLQKQEISSSQQSSSTADQAACCSSLFAPKAHESIVMYHHPSPDSQNSREQPPNQRYPLRNELLPPTSYHNPNLPDYSLPPPIPHQAHYGLNQQIYDFPQNPPSSFHHSHGPRSSILESHISQQQFSAPSQSMDPSLHNLPIFPQQSSSSAEQSNNISRRFTQRLNRVEILPSISSNVSLQNSSAAQAQSQISGVEHQLTISHPK